MNSLLEMNCIDHKLILGLGNKINELYSYQIETRIFIEDFAKKINQKIESIDNFHMLIEEINQNVYNPQYPFLAISKIMSQLDLRTVKDRRKMSILVRSLEQKKILNDEDVLFTKMLEELLLVNENEAGVLAIFFGNIRDEYIAVANACPVLFPPTVVYRIAICGNSSFIPCIRASVYGIVSIVRFVGKSG